MDERRPALAARGLYKSFHDGEQTLEVLRDLELEIEAGTRTAIVGVSGSGKSTLLSLLGGLDVPDRGQVWVCGEESSNCSPAQSARLRNRFLSYVLQHHHLLREFNVLENLLLPLAIRGVGRTEARRRARELLQQVGLAGRERARPPQLSGGERQRAAVAQALVTRPACVLMDEPTGNLDADNAARIAQLLMQLSRDSGVAFLLVTHNPELAQSADRVLRLAQGRLTPV